jgi:hypothetical protein
MTQISKSVIKSSLLLVMRERIVVPVAYGTAGGEVLSGCTVKSLRLSSDRKSSHLGETVWHHARQVRRDTQVLRNAGFSATPFTHT